MVGVTRMVRKAGRRRGCGRNAYSRVMARAGRSVTVPGGRKLLFRKSPCVSFAPCRRQRRSANAHSLKGFFAGLHLRLDRSADEAAALV